MNKKNKGISLIVLVITIIVVIILAAAVILSLGENNPINDSKIASIVQTKDTMESSVHLYLSKGMTQTQGIFSNLQLMTGLEGLPTSEEPVLKQGAVEYKFVVGNNSKPAIGAQSEFIPEKIGTKIENGEEKWLYEIDPVVFKEKVAKQYQIQTSDSSWYIDPISSKIYLIFNKDSSYPQWMIGKDGRVDVNLVDIVGKKTGATDEKEFGNNGNEAGEVINRPKLTPALIPVIFNEQTGEAIEVESSNKDWYEYKAQTGATTNGGTSHWANAITKNNKGQITGYFVWIPRYAYKIANTGTSLSNEINIIFVDINNKDKNGQDIPSGYTVHPAFTDESKLAIPYSNGGWDKEIPGFWVAKYEAGFAGGANTVEQVDSNLTYSGVYSDIRNFYGKITSGSTKIKYPVFLPNTYSYNYINIGDSYAISKNLSGKNNIYQFDTSSLDTHQMKNSEWGAVAYLTHSKYGRNGTEVIINNCNVNNVIPEIYAITGMAGDTVSAASTDNRSSISNQFNGQKGKLASTTGNIYGVYDFSGGNFEYISGYIPNTSPNLNNYGGFLVSDGGINNNTKYKSVYSYDSNLDSNTNNYLKQPNPNRKGEAIWETSSKGSGAKSWLNDYSKFVSLDDAFFRRGGDFDYGSGAGIFAFTCHSSYARSSHGFRCVLI